MKNEDMVLEYFYGCFNYYLLLRNHIYDESNKVDISQESLNAAKVGMISNLMLGIKEQIVEKKENLNYESKIFYEELEKCVNTISKKRDGKYFIDGCCFENPSILTSTIRNKLAHGDFLLDLKKSQIIFNIKSQKVKISINNLTKFVMLAVNNSLNRSNENKFKRMLVISPHYEKKRKKSITELKEVKEFVKTLYKLEINITPKPGFKINKEIRDEFECYLKLFVDFQIKNSIINFKLKHQDDFMINLNLEKIENSEVDKLSLFLYNITPTDEEYSVQVLSYLNEATRILDKNFEKNNLLLSFAKNILYLDTVSTYKTYDKNKIFEKIIEKYDKYYLNYDQLAASILSMFSSLFIYPMEDLHNNPNLFKEGEIEGLDYSKLDMSLIYVEKYTIEKPVYNELLVRRTAISRQIDETTSDYIKNESNLRNVKGNAKVEEIIKNIIKKLEIKKELLNQELNELNNEIANMEKYIATNFEYLKNKSIIEGIRNAISHGNYRVEIGTCMEDSIIIFEDIYNNELAFKSKMTINAFAEFCFNSHDIIFSDKIEKTK